MWNPFLGERLCRCRLHCCYFGEVCCLFNAKCMSLANTYGDSWSGRSQVGGTDPCPHRAITQKWDQLLNTARFVRSFIYMKDFHFGSVEVEMFSALANYSKCLNCTLGFYLQLMANIPCLLATHPIFETMSQVVIYVQVLRCCNFCGITYPPLTV